MFYQYIKTPATFPVPYLLISADEQGITEVSFETEQNKVPYPNEIVNACATQLNEYFQGQRSTFLLPLTPHGTPFQQSVWQHLQHIPYAECWSYQQLAIQVKSKNHCRAVGLANGKNPIAIIIPCHRVIGSNGQLVGYSGGLSIKSWLLEHEKNTLTN